MESGSEDLSLEKEESNTVRIRTCYLYDDHIDRVFEMFTNVEKYNSVFGNFVLDVETIKGKSYGDVGA